MRLTNFIRRDAIIPALGRTAQESVGRPVQRGDALDRPDVVHLAGFEYHRPLPGDPVPDAQHLAHPGGRIGPRLVPDGRLHPGPDAAQKLLVEFGPNDQRAVGAEDDRRLERPGGHGLAG